MMQASRANTDTLVNAGALQAGERIRNGKSEVLYGPFSDTQEQLGGYYVIDVPDLDAAPQCPAGCPNSAYGTIEPRLIWEM